MSANALLAEFKSVMEGDAGGWAEAAAAARIADLFASDSHQFSEAEINDFDDVLCSLIERIETEVLIELSLRLAPVDRSPGKAIRLLARNDEISVAGPVLERSKRLTADDLVQIARSKGLEHLLAIAGRADLEETVTDVLLVCGYSDVVHRVAANATSSFSKNGYHFLIDASRSDPLLAVKAGSRRDIPEHLLRRLVAEASEAVRARLLAVASPEAKGEIERAIQSVSERVERMEQARSRNFSGIEMIVEQMQKTGEFREKDLLRFAREGRHDEVAAALSLLCDAPVRIIVPVMRSSLKDGLLFLCSAAELDWETVSVILRMLMPEAASAPNIGASRDRYANLSKQNCAAILRNWIERG